MNRRPLMGLCEAQKTYGTEKTSFIRPRYVPDGICQWCGKPIMGKRRKTTCCDECKRSFDDVVTWNERGGYGKQILRRDNYTCQDCGTFHAFHNGNGLYLPSSDGQLEIHHIEYVCNGGDDSPENLITLCKECHKKRHKRT